MHVASGDTEPARERRQVLLARRCIPQFGDDGLYPLVRWWPARTLLPSSERTFYPFSRNSSE
jgi:hypothetical protein